MIRDANPTQPGDDPRAPAPAPGGPAASESQHAVNLVDAQRVLGLFAQGLCGRYLHLKPAQALTGNFRPDGVTTDGAALYLPERVDAFACRRHNLGVYRVAVLHQLGLFEHGTYAFSLEAAREHVAQLPAEPARRGVAAVDLERFFSLWSAPALMRRLFMTLEDMRIDRRMHLRYPGARADLDRVLARALDERPSIDALAPFAALLEGLVRYSLGALRADLLRADASGMLAPLLDAADLAAAEHASVYDSARAAAACYRLLERAGFPRARDGGARAPRARGTAGPNAANPGGEDPAAEFDEDAMGIATVGFRGEVMPELVQRQLRARGVAGAPGERTTPAAPDPGAKASQPARELPGRQLEADRTVLYRAFGSVDAGARSYLYDEWDFLRQTYVKGWCRLYEHRLRGEDFDFVRRVRQRHALLARQVKRQFATVRPQSYRRVRRVNEGEELEIDAVIETVLDRLAGRIPQDRVYARREKAQREVAAAFVLDMSASTDYPVPDPDAPPEPARADEDDDPFLWSVRREADDDVPQPPRRRVIDVAKESLALMCEALETLGDRHAVYGFSGYGHDDVEFYVAKDFADRLCARTWAAMAAMTPRRSTRMGTAIRHAASKLQRQEARTKLLIVVSDGYPEDHDYGPDRSDHEYGIQDTARALQEAERAGVQTFCVTIDRAGRDYLRRMCPEDRYMVIDEVEHLPHALAKVYRALAL